MLKLGDALEMYFKNDRSYKKKEETWAPMHHEGSEQGLICECVLLCMLYLAQCRRLLPPPHSARLGVAGDLRMYRKKMFRDLEKSRNNLGRIWKTGILEDATLKGATVARESNC